MEIEHGISHEKMSKKLFLMDISFIMEKKSFYIRFQEKHFCFRKCEDIFCCPRTENPPLLCITSYLQISAISCPKSSYQLKQIKKLIIIGLGEIWLKTWSDMIFCLQLIQTEEVLPQVCITILFVPSTSTTPVYKRLICSALPM